MKNFYLFILLISLCKGSSSPHVDTDNSSAYYHDDLHHYDHQNENQNRKDITTTDIIATRSLSSTSTCSIQTLQNTPFQIISSDVTTADGQQCCMYPQNLSSSSDTFYLFSGPCETQQSINEKNILWSMDNEGKIRSMRWGDKNKKCLTRYKKRIKVDPCQDGNKSQIWAYSSFDQTILWRYSLTLIITTSVDVLPNDGTRTKLIKRKSDGTTVVGQAWTLNFPVEEEEPQIVTTKTEYTSGESIDGTFVNPEPDSNAWIAIYPASEDPLALPTGSTMWNWYRSQTSGSFSFSSTSDHGGESWPLCDGEWRVFLINGDIIGPYVSIANSNTFSVSGGDCSYTGPCDPATSDKSSYTHQIPVDGDDVRKVAFSSCYKPANQISTALWDHVRGEFGADVWSWLGDNTYSDGNDMEYKRTKYNEGKGNAFYTSAGPIADPKISVTGTWDDHDFGANNMGRYYKCRQPSQNEFAYFFDLLESDPRHPAQGANQREGVYHSYMFSKPNSGGSGGGNGIHLIHIDARYHRSPSFASYGPCEGSDSTILGETQWTWLQNELNQPSEVKIIGSGIQVLPPTYRGRSVDEYCSYDGVGGTFDSSNAAVGEGGTLDSSEYEMWSEYPQERMKLLKLAQKSINDGNAKKIVFLSGDQHWGEIQAKKMPSDPTYGPPQTLYEVTASGIDQRWNYNVPNANRIRIRSADYRGNNDFTKECNFPFIYNGVTYNDCTNVDESKPWCSIETDNSNNHITGEWGYCLDEKEEEELVPRTSISYSNEHTCSDNYLHVCSAQANYGGVEVDWVAEKLILSVFTPHEDETVAASVSVDL